MDKAQLRKAFQAKRSQVLTHTRDHAARAAAGWLIQHDYFQHNKHFAAYLCFRNEFDAMPIIEAIWQAKKLCYLPVLQGEKLEFVLYEYGAALHTNRYSILEPINTQQKIAAEHLDVVIAPLVAFDSKGHRLGAGGGYYDKTFSFKHKQEKPVLIGLGYARQEAEAIPGDAWDVRLDAVLTENGLMRF